MAFTLKQGKALSHAPVTYRVKEEKNRILNALDAVSGEHWCHCRRDQQEPRCVRKEKGVDMEESHG